MIRNNYSVLPIYERISDQHHRKTYAFGQAIPIISDVNQIPPFQFQLTKGGALESIKMVRMETGEEFERLTQIEAAGLEIENFDDFDLVKYPSRFRLSGGFMQQGNYYLVITGLSGTFVRYSDVFCMGTVTNDLIEIEFCHSRNIEFSNGVISYDNYFKNRFYFNSELGKPKYQYEETVTKRDGQNFPLQQISYKLHLFETFLNEEVLDVLRLLRLHDFVKLKHKGETWDIDEIIVTPEWLEQGDVARVEFEIKTDTVVIVNGRGVATADCEIPAGACFDVEKTSLAILEFGGLEWNGHYYLKDGEQIDLVDGDLIIRQAGNTYQILSFSESFDDYVNVVTVEDSIIFDSRDNIYFQSTDTNGNLQASTFIKGDAVVSGFALPNSIVEVWVKFANDSEQLIEIGTADEYSGDGIGYLKPSGATSIQVRHSGGICENYYISEYIDFTGICEFVIQGTYLTIEAAEADGVQDDEYFLIAANNPYGMPPNIVMQLNPSQTFSTDSSARQALGNDTCYAVAQSNNYGLAFGVVRALITDSTIYDNDTQATSGGFGFNTIYAWSGGGSGFSNLFKLNTTDASEN